MTANSVPPGPSARASDPVLAYDALHGVWLANTLAIAPDATRLTIHRSRDGVAWTGPIDAARAPAADLAYDKNWLTCDNGATSPFRGRCYLAYTLVGEQEGEDDLAVQYSVDGGLTWSAAATVHVPVTGVIPVVQPNGTLTLFFWSPRTGMVAVRSTDGAATLGAPATVASFRFKDARPFRAPPIPAADIDGTGRIVAVWQDCRFRSDCQANDIVFTRSPDGTTWSQPARVTRGRNAVMPTIGVEPGTGRLAIAYYVIRPDGVDAELVTSRDGTSWSAPQRLTPRRMAFAWMPETSLGRMLADYIGVTWSSGRPLVVYALASPPRNGKLRQAIYAASGSEEVPWRVGPASRRWLESHRRADRAARCDLSPDSQLSRHRAAPAGTRRRRPDAPPPWTGRPRAGGSERRTPATRRRGRRSARPESHGSRRQRPPGATRGTRSPFSSRTAARRAASLNRGE